MRPAQVGEIVGSEPPQRKDLPKRPAAEQHDQQDGEQETRNRVAEDDQRGGDGVEARAVLDRLSDAERDRDRVGDERHPQPKRDRDRQFFLDQLEHRNVAIVALAEIEGRIVAHQDPEPLPGRLVEAVLLLQLLDEFRIEALRAAIARRDVAASLAAPEPIWPPPPPNRAVELWSAPCSCAIARSTGPPGTNCTIAKETAMIPRIVGIIRSRRRRI